jgi:putative lipid kinase YegS-like protein
VIAKGEPWGSPATTPADHEVSGDDRALAAAVAEHPGALIAFTPDASSELARTVGLGPDNDGGDDDREAMDLPMDVLALGDGTLAVNMVVFGTPPDALSRFTKRTALHIRADGKIWFNDRGTTVVLAIGQWLHGIDLVPRGHPGDGRVEIQAYRLEPGERRGMRKRLPQGAHLPHPRIPNRTARMVEIEAEEPLPLEVDGEVLGPVRRLRAEVRTGAYRLLV